MMGDLYEVHDFAAMWLVSLSRDNVNCMQPTISLQISEGLELI